MRKINKIQVTRGVHWVEVQEADLRVLCGCPADAVKHLMKRGLIVPTEADGVVYETGPNAILLSDVLLQNGEFANLAEFPVLQMLYLQGMLLPGHPNNTGARPLLIGSEAQIRAQMEYIYRGNYGLVSQEELVAAGLKPDEAVEHMRMKLKFAFGRIRPTEELLDSVKVGSKPVEVRAGVTVRRLRLNVFEFSYQDETVAVDINLPPLTGYEPPYRLPYHDIQREYFAVIHSGEGDGWDINRPCMASILMFQGRTYLLDAGPNILHSLSALGIGINEIEGVFHTHAHDDHFCGLATLMHSDHRIKYYAVPWVRASVTKKLAALVGMEERHFADYFDVRELAVDQWNDVEGLEVKPVFSPHPVETTIMFFRAMGADGYKTYAHFADIVSLGVLAKMVTSDPKAPGVSQSLYDRVAKDYGMPASLKKLDIGGGLIHGDAEDFKDDPSSKIILSHTARELSQRQKEIGSGAPFGMVDALIPGEQDFLRVHAFNYLRSYFPEAALDQLRMLANNPIVTFNPETILLKSGERTNELYLVVSGEVEMIRTAQGMHNLLSAGALVGELPAMSGMPSLATYRAAAFVNALCLPRSQYLVFVNKSGLKRKLADLHERREFLQKTWLFGESVSFVIQNRVAQVMELMSCEAGRELDRSGDLLYLLKSGAIQVRSGDEPLETLNSGDFFGEGCVLYNMPCVFRVSALDHSELYTIPAKALEDIPIVRWKLFETHRRRTEMMLNPELIGRPLFQWQEEYKVGMLHMDEQHRGLLKAADALYRAINAGEERTALGNGLGNLVGLAKGHFRDEEQFMSLHDYPGLKGHAEQHARLLQEMRDFRDAFERQEKEMDGDFVECLKDWVVEHILLHDRKYGRHLKSLES